MIVDIIHLIRLAAVSCGRPFRGRGLLFATPPGAWPAGQFDPMPSPKPPETHGGRATPKKSGSDASSSSPTDSKISKTNRHGILWVMVRNGWTDKGLKLFQIVKKGCSDLRGFEFPNWTPGPMAYGQGVL